MENNELTTLFWRKNKHKYKHLDINIVDVVQICKAPFIQMKLNVQGKTMKDIRMPYLGLFAIKTRLVCWELHWAYKDKDKDQESAQHYQKVKELFKKRLKIAWSEYSKHKKMFEHIIDITPYEKEIKPWDSSKLKETK